MVMQNLMTLVNGFKDELEAIRYFIDKRWNGKITCPFKECPANEFNDTENKIYTLKSGHDYRCSCCSKTFSYKTGTMFENSKVDLKKWFTAIYLHTANKKGISSCQLAKHIGITQKTAWFMLHRIRFAITTDSDNDTTMYEGKTEADELYLGGKEGNKHTKDKFKTTKTPMLGIVNRDTKKATIKQVKSTEYHNLGKEIMNKVEVGSDLITDSYSSYIALGRYYSHESVNHSVGDYVKVSKAQDGKEAFKVHTNTVEGLFGNVRRVINGTYHFISVKHAQSYMNEIAYRYNTRKQHDFARFTDFFEIIKARLTYNKLIGA